MGFNDKTANLAMFDTVGGLHLTKAVLLIAGWCCWAPVTPAQGQLAPGDAFPLMNHAMYDVVAEGYFETGRYLGEGGTLVVFWSNQCVWVDRYEERLLALSEEAREENVALIFVNANNDEVFPQENRESSREQALKGNYPVYLMDEDGEAARMMGAQRTPHVYIFSSANSLLYSGAIDDSPADPEEAQARYVDEILAAMRSGTTPTLEETAPFGCRIKP